MADPNSNYATTEAPPCSWRLRDAAISLQHGRPPPHQFNPNGSAGSSSSSSMPLGVVYNNNTNEDTLSVAPEVIASAFGGAAAAVLQALQRMQQQESAAAAAAATTTTNAMVDQQQEAEQPQSWRSDLPACLHSQQQESPQQAPRRRQRRLLQHPWSALRAFSLERAHENKEYCKRKGGKTDKAFVLPGGGGGGVSSTTTTSSNTTTKNAKQLTNKVAAAPPAKVPSNSSSSSNTFGVAATTTTATALAAPVTSAASSKQLRQEPVVAVANEAARTNAVAPAPPLKKFTRNTPASSAAALDTRVSSARAILCCAGNLLFSKLTPGEALPQLEVPQAANSAATTATTTTTTAPNCADSHGNNLGAVLVQAQTLAQRTAAIVENAVRRSALRYQYRKDNAATALHRVVENPFAAAMVSDASSTDEDDDDEHQASAADDDDDEAPPYQPNPDSITYMWQSVCLPRFLSVLNTGAGHAVYHDVEWSCRHGRLADLLRAQEKGSLGGPHLIVTTQPELANFASEFQGLNLSLLGAKNATKLQLHALVYRGTRRRRRALRKYFSQATGLANAPFHVLITSYRVLLEDFLHFCQVPFETVILDDGAAWMAAKDSNSPLGHLWDSGLFSSNDHHVGLAGTSFKEWDYRKDSFSEAVVKEAWVGLTARHRIMTASKFCLKLRQSTELAPVSSLLDFVAPHFAAVAKEEWDRSRIAQDAASMKHFRGLVARSVVVHSCDSVSVDPNILALQALTGKLEPPDRSEEPLVPSVVSDDDFVSSGKVAYARRSLLQWLGPLEKSWLRYELGCANLQPILDAMKISNYHGHFCEEITTASSTTSSGATGQVAGTMAYRLAIRGCGRHFGSEPGLRQHLSAHHAPPGTWLCRTCSCDCISSQSRTHHERSCGQPVHGVAGDPGGTVGATPTVGQGASKKAGVGKKKSTRPQPSSGTSPGIEQDPDGAFRVPAYRGVWVNKSGKYFVKVGATRLTETEKSKKVLLFDSAIDAAKKHDSILTNSAEKDAKVELNFKPDGTRIVYEDITPASTTGLGGSAANVVPALSVINIKDLPADVKPLLRDPRQTSRTGGNSKRHVYAYRGVCRQARKGLDRWQSQISFMGVNHYLGTFDSEWDAAAVYAWAHLILYGDEATRQAQKEGEEAAAAYEQEKKDIAEGKILPPKQEKKKKTPAKKEKKTGTEGNDAGEQISGPRKRKAKDPNNVAEKKPRGTAKAPKGEKEAMIPILAKAVVKVPMLAPREDFSDWTHAELIETTARKVTAARDSGYGAASKSTSTSGADDFLRPCVPTGSDQVPIGGAMLFGLSASAFGWDLQEYVQSLQLGSEQDSMAALQLLAVEYDEDGVNERFSSIVQSTVCVVGNADKMTQQMYNSLGFGTVPVGGSVGAIDCHIGGVPGSCSERAACIRFAPTEESDFQFACLSSDDHVSLNGKRITPDMGSVPLVSQDICCVGARVFAFLLPADRSANP